MPGIDRTSVQGIWWRQTRPGLAPLSRRIPPADGRWQRGEKTEAAYFAESESTAWAEWYRALAEAALPPRADLPRELWRFSIDLEDIADLSTEERLRAVGLERPAPRRGDWPAFQQMGERLQEEGFTGLVAPSAARTEGRVLCVFRNTDAVAGIEVRGKRRLIAEPPVLPIGLGT